MKLFIVLLLIGSSLCGIKHNCVHHKVLERIDKTKLIHPEDPKKKTDSTVTDERLLADPERPIRIVYDYTELDKSTDVKFKTYIKETIMPHVRNVIQSFMKVNDSQSITAFSTTGCDADFTVPSHYHSNDTDADIIIFVMSSNEDESWLAWAGACSLRGGSKRPIVGVTNINEKYIEYSKKDVEYFARTMIHEVMHILGFSNGLFTEFNITVAGGITETVSKNYNGTTKDVIKLKTPKVIEVARAHYNCNSLTGMYMENDGSAGSAGSHWEKIHNGHDIMIAQDTGDEVITELTLALFEDTGWYIIDRTKAEKNTWGKGRGCDFIENNTACGTSKEFCSTSTEKSCTTDYHAKASCTTTGYTTGCLINELFDSNVCTSPHSTASSTKKEIIGPASRCFELTQTDGSKFNGCYTAACSGGKIQISVEGGAALECTTNGETLTLTSSLTITCPNITEFCDLITNDCADSCNGNGNCLLDNTCRCFYWWSGVTCGTENKCKLEEASICGDINPGGAVETDPNAQGIVGSTCGAEESIVSFSTFGGERTLEEEEELKKEAIKTGKAFINECIASRDYQKASSPDRSFYEPSKDDKKDDSSIEKATDGQDYDLNLSGHEDEHHGGDDHKDEVIPKGTSVFDLSFIIMGLIAKLV